jgi:hypothetical protein
MGKQHQHAGVGVVVEAKSAERALRKNKPKRTEVEDEFEGNRLLRALGG